MVDGACLCRRNFTMPVLRGVASPGHLHIHHVSNGDGLGNLGVDFRVLLEGLHGQADPFITDIALMIMCSRVSEIGATGISKTTWRVLVKKAFMAKNLPSYDSTDATPGSSEGGRGCWHQGTPTSSWVFLRDPKCSFMVGPDPRLGDFRTWHLTPNAVELLHSPAVPVDQCLTSSLGAQKPPTTVSGSGRRPCLTWASRSWSV